MKMSVIALLACTLALGACNDRANIACDPNAQDCGQRFQGGGGSHMSPLVAGAIGAGAGALIMHHHNVVQQRRYGAVPYGYHPGYGSYGHPYGGYYGRPRTVVVHHYNTYGGYHRAAHVYHH